MPRNGGLMTRRLPIMWSTPIAWLLGAAMALPCAALSAASPTVDSDKMDTLAALRSRPAEGEVIYLIMPDRFANADPSNDGGGLSGDRSITGFDPYDKAYYHGGDIKGVTSKLDYIQGLGATAIWLTPVFRNKAVQEYDGYQSAGYHGYWPVDFTDIDPHLG